jgi:hypothetical protein
MAREFSYLAHKAPQSRIEQHIMQASGAALAGIPTGSLQTVVPITLGGGLSIVNGALTMGAGGPYVLKTGDTMTGALGIKGSVVGSSYLTIGGANAGDRVAQENIPGAALGSFITQIYDRTNSVYGAWLQDANSFQWRVDGVSKVALSSAGILTAATAAAGTNTTQVATTAFVSEFPQNRYINKLVNAQFLYGYVNAYIPSTWQNARDCWKGTMGGAGVYTMSGQSADPPTGFATGSAVYLSYQTTTADASIAATDFYDYRTYVEGFDCIDLQWGTANAKAVTLSFWTRASVAGNYSGAFKNAASDRAYCFQYNIAQANTWEQKVINVPGDTSGTWLRSSLAGILLIFDLGSGSNYQGTANAWQAGNLFGVTGSQKLIDTVGRTWRLCLPQLQIGTFTTAPPFEFLPLAEYENRLERYVEAQTRIIVSSYSAAAATRYHTVVYRKTKRAIPSITYGDLSSSGYAAGVPTTNYSAADMVEVYKTSSGAGEAYYIFNILADASL